MINDYLEQNKERKVELKDKTAIKIYTEKIKPAMDKIKPLVEDIEKIEKEKEEVGNKYKELEEKFEEKKSEIDKHLLKKNKFINRVSPIIQDKYGDELNEFQDFGRIMEEDGKIWVTIKDWLVAFAEGHRKKKEKKEEDKKETLDPKIGNKKMLSDK